MNFKKLIISILIMSLFQNASIAAFWSKNVPNDIGNDIQKEEYPESKDVEPKVDETLVIKGVLE